MRLPPKPVKTQLFGLTSCSSPHVRLAAPSPLATASDLYSLHTGSLFQNFPSPSPLGGKTPTFPSVFDSNVSCVKLPEGLPPLVSVLHGQHWLLCCWPRALPMPFLPACSPRGVHTTSEARGLHRAQPWRWLVEDRRPCKRSLSTGAQVGSVPWTCGSSGVGIGGLGTCEHVRFSVLMVEVSVLRIILCQFFIIHWFPHWLMSQIK